jgi:hypothetical protein
MNNASSIYFVFESIGNVLGLFWWIILPIAFFYIFKFLFKDYVGWYSANSWYANQKYCLLEIIPPREIEKGPKLMESFFQGLTGVLTTYNPFQEWMEGAWFHDRFSLELVGEEGKVHFYIRPQKKHRNMIEAQIYAQYPDAGIIEVEDYIDRFPKVVPTKNWNIWGTDFEFVAPDAYPIKTYDHFEESISGEMIDPMAALVEVMGTLGPGQHIWLQYILQPIQEQENRKKYAKVLDKLTGRGSAQPTSVWEHMLDVFSNLLGALFGPVEFKKSEKKEESPLEFRLTPIEKEVLKAVEENIGRNFFSVKMRLINLAKRDVFETAKTSAIVGAIKQFNDMNYNQVKPNDKTKTYANFIMKKKRMEFRQRLIYSRYKKRNRDGALLVLSTKELATLFHFPDMNVKSPAVQRTEAKLGAPPANLPVE